MITNDDVKLKNVQGEVKMPTQVADLSPEQYKEDEKYMRRCLQLARQGRVGARPNPMVGAVVVCDGCIIGEGYHICQGGPHAEVHAIRSVRQPERLPQSTIYVSLEPCSHYGKTPPCADLIISTGIKRCVVGCKDPFAQVDGQGIRKLLDAGVEVTVGVLEQECLALNQTFVTYHTLKRPYITLKWAQSMDGLMDALPKGEKPVKFSTKLSMTLMHRRRALSDAILVGGRTALNDNPTLTVRNWSARGETGNLPMYLKEKYGDVSGNPLRVVIDTHGNLPADLNLFNEEAETLVWSGCDLNALMRELHKKNVQTLLVEGGAETLRQFLDEGLWDEMRVETAPFKLCTGVEAPSLEGLCPAEVHFVDGNTISVYRH